MLLETGKIALMERAHADYKAEVPGEYDEVLHEVTARAAAAGSLNKLDIGGLVFWKRLQANVVWVPKLMALPDAQVRSVTALAYNAVNDSRLSVPEAARAGRSALAELPGFDRGDALASAVLLAAAPDRMAIYDRRAHAALNKLDLSLTNARGRYGRYMELVERIRGEMAGRRWTAREVDQALFWLGRPAPR